MSSSGERGAYTYEPTLVIPGTSQAHLRFPHMEDAPEGFALIEANRNYLAARRESWIADVQTADHLKNRINKLNIWAQIGIALPYWLVAGPVAGGGPLIGHLLLYHHDKTTRRAFFGGWIDEVHQGQGFVTLGAGALFDYVQQDSVWNLQEVAAHISVDNQQSEALADRLGFQVVSGPFSDPEELDTTKPRILREWSKQL